MTVTSHRSVAAALAAVLLVASVVAACGNSSPTPSPAPTASPTPVPTFAVPSYTLAPSPSGCPTSAPPAVSAYYKATVTLQTPLGNIVINLDGGSAQNAVAAFVALAKCGYYDNVIFHRIVPKFVIQTGDGQYGRMPLTPDVAKVGQGTPGWTIKDDPVKQTYKRGTVAMARGSAANSGGSQFFIVLDDSAAQTLGEPTQANNYAIVGQVTSGMDVVDKIASVPTTVADTSSGEQSFPLYPIPILGTDVTEP